MTGELRGAREERNEAEVVMRELVADVGGRGVHYLDFGGEGVPMVLAHGHGGSRFSWAAAGPRLAQGHRVLAPDFPGFGDTPVEDMDDVTVEGQRRALGSFIEEVVGAPAVLVGSSMGGMIAIHHAAARADQVLALVLSDPAVPSPPGAEPTGSVASIFVTFMQDDAEDQLEAQFAITSVEEAVRDGIQNNYADPARAPREVVERQIALGHRRRKMPWANRALIHAGRSLIETYLDQDRYDEAIRAVTAPTLLIHGANDRLVPVSAARRVAELRPDWTYEEFDDCGHLPHNEHPDRFASLVAAWIGNLALYR